jgi:hypothetical protein
MSLILAVLLWAAGALASTWGEGVDESVAVFLEVLNRPCEATLQDYYGLVGRTAELELQFEVAHCKRNGWVPAESNSRCIRYTRWRALHARTARSFYLAWLRQMIPPSRDVEVISVDTVKREGELGYQLVKARIGKTDVEFYRGVDKRGPSGIIDVRRINGISVVTRLQEKLKAESTP